MTILLTKNEYAHIQEILTTYQREKNQLKIYQKKYLENNRERVKECNKKSLYNKYHNDPEYRERKLQAMKLYNAKKKAENSM